MDRVKVRLKKNGFVTEFNLNIARILIRKGEAELAEREVPRRGAKPAEEQKPGHGRKTKKDNKEPATEESQESDTEETSETDGE